MIENAAKLTIGAVLGLVLLSCTGKVELSRNDQLDAGDAQECKRAAAVFSSGDAMSIARCFGGLPLGAQLAGIQPWGPVDTKGLASWWALTWIAGSSSYLQLIGAASSSIAPESVGTMSSCTTALSDVASSGQVVPDALARLSGKGIHADSITGIRFLAMGDCSSLATRPGLVVRALVAPHANEAPSQRWGLRYLLDGSFVELCGPCPMTGEDACVACASGK